MKQKRHDELAAMLARCCHGENVQDVLIAAALLAANAISKDVPSEFKELATDNFLKALEGSIADLDAGDGYKISADKERH
jgi:hypothetical protein